MPTPPRRRWFQFSRVLRVFIGTCLGFGLGGLAGNIVNAILVMSLPGGIAAEEANSIFDTSYIIQPATSIAGALIGAWIGWKRNRKSHSQAELD